jgi:hypothetical protein
MREDILQVRIRSRDMEKGVIVGQNQAVAI